MAKKTRRRADIRSDYAVAAGQGCAYIRGGYVVTQGGEEVVVGRFTNADETRAVYVGTKANGLRLLLTQEKFDHLPKFKLC